jgi:hypothetical protein
MNTYYLRKFRKKAKRKYRVQRYRGGYVVEYREPVYMWVFDRCFTHLENAIRYCNKERREYTLWLVYEKRNRELAKL